MILVHLFDLPLSLLGLIMFAFRYMYHVDQFASVVNQEFVGQCFYHRNKQIQSPASTSSKLWWIAKPTGKQVRNFPLEYSRTLTGYSQQGFLSQWCMECQIVRCSFLYINADFLKRVLSKNSQAFTGFNHRDITVEPPPQKKKVNQWEGNPFAILSPP